MNTTCRFEEDDVIPETPETRMRLVDLPGVTDVYICKCVNEWPVLIAIDLLCPKNPLVNERDEHRRLAKRDAGVCEAHRGQTIRAQKKLKSLGLSTFRHTFSTC